MSPRVGLRTKWNNNIHESIKKIMDYKKKERKTFYKLKQKSNTGKKKLVGKTGKYFP